MIHDEELRSSLDYSAGQKEAAYRILIELVNFEILNELKNKTLSNKELAALAKSAYGFNRESVDT